jgi:hypothetical protein
MTAPAPDQDPARKRRDPVPFWIMGALVLAVIAIVLYGPY